MTRKLSAVVVAFLVAGLMVSVAGQEPIEGGDFGDIIGDINTFGGPLHDGFYVIPGLGIQMVIPLYHWQGLAGGRATAPQWEVNKGNGSGYCQVCVYLFDAFPFFGPPVTAVGNPIVNQTYKIDENYSTIDECDHAEGE